MQSEIRNKPSFANIKFQLEPGETITCESDAMASMDSTINMKTKLNGGLFKGLARKFLGGESLFINEFSTESGGELVVTQAWPGDIECLELNNTTMYLQPGAYIASEPGVKLKLGWAGFASFIGREGLFRLKVTGTGKIWFGCYGGIFVKEIQDTYVVDSGHLVAYEPSIGIKVGMAGGIFSSFFSGEGLVTRIKGPGRIYMQSRSTSGLTGWINSHLW